LRPRRSEKQDEGPDPLDLLPELSSALGKENLAGRQTYLLVLRLDELQGEPGVGYLVQHCFTVRSPPPPGHI
jgi:hypothetical protein